MIRVAAVGDVHFGPDARGRLRPHIEGLADEADVLLLAGDLTRLGLREEAEALAGELAGLPVPAVAVLGNHDYHSDHQDGIAGVMEDAGVQVLEGGSAVIEVGGSTVGVAGGKGFGGGFAGASGSDFGEPLMKAFVRHTVELAVQLHEQLDGLRTDWRVALTHYAPVDGTLRGERPEIYPFLGSVHLAEAVDRAGADLAVHGHAHAGSERGVTPGGVPVRNVAQPVIGRAYSVYCLGQEETRNRSPGGRHLAVVPAALEETDAGDDQV
ncbi:MAG TPA: metallophosphoesterase [Acidimicrobiales bacterium]|nr:metallophosphoesterase [Acidimicrobiales bacterium]